MKNEHVLAQWIGLSMGGVRGKPVRLETETRGCRGGQIQEISVDPTSQLVHIRLEEGHPISLYLKEESMPTISPSGEFRYQLPDGTLTIQLGV